jgi:hypothetical protein
MNLKRALVSLAATGVVAAGAIGYAALPADATHPSCGDTYQPPCETTTTKAPTTSTIPPTTQFSVTTTSQVTSTTGVTTTTGVTSTTGVTTTTAKAPTTTAPTTTAPGAPTTTVKPTSPVTASCAECKRDDNGIPQSDLLGVPAEVTG